MRRITEANSGIYLLEIFASAPFNLDIKKFFGIKFPKGFYYYSGSSQKNFRQRLSRHIRKNKTIHWHIDYITTHPKLKISTIYLFEGAAKNFECELVNDLVKKIGCSINAIGFGNGDCKTCDTHLLYSPLKIDQSHFISLYHSTVRIIASSMLKDCL